MARMEGSDGVRIFSLVLSLILPLLVMLSVAAQRPGTAREVTCQDGGNPSILAPTLRGERPAASVQWNTVILADPDDPYYALAKEIAQHEALPIAHFLDEAIARDPVFLLWIVSPWHLSDQVLVDFGLAMRDRQSAISMGIISGATLEEARELWLRASEVKGRRVIAATAANPSGHIEAKIIIFDEGGATIQPLSKANLKQGLQDADYLTFTGHGGWTRLELEPGKNTWLHPADIPELPPVVIATASCNTFRIWEKNSIALAFTSKGAAAYAGFAYSPNEGYLMGEFEGSPFRYTWPDFPIGHVIQVQNHGTLQGFAQFPYYYLLGDPRIALQTEAPYRLIGDREDGGVRTLTYSGAPAGFIPVRIPGGARYSLVEIPGVAAAWERDRLYNGRLQMMNIRDDKLVLFDHKGGDFTLRLRVRPPSYWMVTDSLPDSLDHTLLYIPQTGGDIISLFASGIALVGVVWMLWRRKGAARTLAASALTGMAFAVLHGIYALARLDHVTITSKVVQFSPLSVVATCLLTFTGAFLFLNIRSRLLRVAGLFVATFPAWAAAAFGLGVMGIMNTFFFKPELGVGLYNYSIGLMPLGAFMFECVLFGLAFSVLRKLSIRSH